MEGRSANILLLVLLRLLPLFWIENKYLFGAENKNSRSAVSMWKLTHSSYCDWLFVRWILVISLVHWYCFTFFNDAVRIQMFLNACVWATYNHECRLGKLKWSLHSPATGGIYMIPHLFIRMHLCILLVDKTGPMQRQFKPGFAVKSTKIYYLLIII